MGENMATVITAPLANRVTPAIVGTRTLSIEDIAEKTAVDYCVRTRDFRRKTHEDQYEKTRDALLRMYSPQYN